jgi:hypothetical protein
MKQRMIDREMYENKAMRRMPHWAQKLHIHMYLNVADFAGIADLDPEYAAFKCNMINEPSDQDPYAFRMPLDIETIAEGLKPMWNRIRTTEYFVMPNFIQQTQGTGFITWSSNSHVYILKDMEKRWLDGLLDVQQIVSDANPSVVVEPLDVTIAKLNAKCEKADTVDKANGYKGNSKAINNAMRIFQVLGDAKAMGFKEGSKDEALALENSVEAIELMPQKEAEAEPTANF